MIINRVTATVLIAVLVLPTKVGLDPFLALLAGLIASGLGAAVELGRRPRRTAL